MSDEIRGTDWPETAIDLVVADYFDMLKLQLAGQGFNKAARNRALQALTGRSHGSIEFKHQNISAVMKELELPQVTGYLPRENYQNALFDGVDRLLQGDGNWLLTYVPDISPTDGAGNLVIGPPPPLSSPKEGKPKALRRLIRKYDAAARDARNRALGKRGEEFIFHAERQRLVTVGRADLADKVQWIADELGDGAGFDIHSFEENGKDRLIEVKTTNGSARTPFYISENERAFSEERPDVFKLVRLHDFRLKPAAFQLVPPLGERVRLHPSVYRASFS